MSKPFYLLGEDNWDYINKNGWIAIPVYGGIVFDKIGYVSLFLDHESPEIRQISQNEIDELVTLRDLSQEHASIFTHASRTEEEIL